MSNRVSETIVLCEDETHIRLVSAYLRALGLRNSPPYVREIVASRMTHGGNVQWVIEAFPKQLEACRKRAARAKTLLIVVLDADKFSVDERLEELHAQLKVARHEPLSAADPVAILIPKRNCETWIAALLGRDVEETTDYKGKTYDRTGFREAAQTLHDWSRPGQSSPTIALPSLARSFPEWRKIG